MNATADKAVDVGITASHAPAQAGTSPAGAVQAVRVEGAQRVVAEVERLIAAGAVAGAFQDARWLKHAYDVARALRGAEAVLVAAFCARSGGLVAALPLAVWRARGLVHAEIVDAGVADYTAPLLGRGAQAELAPRDLLRALVGQMRDIDLLRLEKMPAAVDGVRNPLAVVDGARPSRFHANRLDIETTVDAFIAARGKKYRKEAERCWRRLNELGCATVTPAVTRADVDATYVQLESWQAQRHHEAGHVYALDRPELSRFYLELARDGLESGFARLFSLAVGGRPIAALYGIARGNTFTLLRIADAGRAFSAVSPGRMIVIEAMRQLVEQGVTRFDMGIGDYPFKRWIGCRSEPLVDLTVARSWKGAPIAAAERTHAWARGNTRLRAVAAWVRGRRRPSTGESSGQD